MRWNLLPVILGLLVGGSAPAQDNRFELGQHLRALEQAWDAMPPNEEAKRRALPPMKASFQQFFTFRLGEAARSLDQARWAIRDDKEPSFVERWTATLSVMPEFRLLDRDDKSVTVRVSPFYTVQGMAPQATLNLSIDGSPVQMFPLEKLPAEFTFLLPALDRDADQTLTSAIVVDGQQYQKQTQTISRVARCDARLAALAVVAEKIPDAAPTIEKGTIRHLHDIFGFLREKTTLETNYPSARLLTEAEAIQGDAKYYGPAHPGQFWLRIPTGDNTVVARLMVPKKLAKERPVPLVIALHGAGGSENLFFDGYGDGAIVKACEERGWMLVATRSPGFVGVPPVGKVIDALAERYPIDRQRIYLVGHSMGASQTVALSMKEPKLFAAVAALGGGGTVRGSDELKSLPFFIGIGKEDFALSSARSLAKSLEKARVQTVALREYPDIEHMVIVWAAMPDVMQFFERHRR